MHHSILLRLRGFICAVLVLAIPAGHGSAQRAILIPAKVGISTMTSSDQATLWKRVDDWATADSLLEFCGRKLNIYKRAWNAVTACVETPSLRKVAKIFRAKKSSYLKILGLNYPDEDKKKAFCGGLAPQLKDYSRIINDQIAEARGMCDACLWC